MRAEEARTVADELPGVITVENAGDAPAALGAV
jgi:hypothetical protein